MSAVKAIPRPPSMVEVFEQRKMWWPGKGEVGVPIRQLGDEHLRHLIAYLERNVASLRTAWGIEVFCGPIQPIGEAAQDAVDSAIAQDAQQTDHEWLVEQPLYKALIAERARRRLS